MVQVEELKKRVEERLVYLRCRGGWGLYWRHNLKKAGWADKDGRVSIRLDDRPYLEHRLVFLIHNGYLPGLVDHKDRDPSNNDINNLRDADKRVNSVNRGEPCNNRSGFRGVSWHKAGGKWTAQIKDKGVKIHLGSFENIEDAIEARKLAEEELWCDIR